MRAKSRWALLIFGLGASTLVNSAWAEPGSGFLDALRVPAIFGGSEKGGREGESTAPTRTNSNTKGFAKPGNSTARSSAIPAGHAASDTQGTSGSSFSLFPKFSTLDKTVSKILGKEPQVGESAEGIVAPPPPTLTATPPEAAPTATAASPGATPIPQIPALPQPSSTTKTQPEPNWESVRIPLRTTPRVSEVASQVDSSQTVKINNSATHSSRRTWNKSTDTTYTALDEGPTAEADAPLEVSKLIDRRPSADPSPEATFDSASTGTLNPQNIEALPQPVIFGREHQEPATDSNRFSTAVRLARPLETSTPSPSKSAEYTPRPAVLDYNASPTPSSAVQPASYDLPPIVSAAEARRMRAEKGK